MAKWLYNFLKKMGIEEDVLFEVDVNGQTHFIDSELIIETILKSEDRKSIKKKLESSTDDEAINYFKEIGKSYIEQN